MRINNNLMAMNTHRQLGVANGAGAKSMEKLSSGFRINRAGDDAAGLAISEKMRGQIRGLNQASTNAQDGISLIQTAEGALNETHAILQRMRELAVQSATDTNTEADRGNIQDEIDQLTEEITRIANTTEFNTMTLLDGSFDGKKFHIGANKDQNVELEIGKMDSEALKLLQNAGNAGDLSATAGVKVIDTTGKLENLTFTKGGDEGGKVVVSGSVENGDLSIAVDEDVKMKDLVASLKDAGLKVEIDEEKYNGVSLVVTDDLGTTGKVKLERLKEWETIDYAKGQIGDETNNLIIEDHTGKIREVEVKIGSEGAPIKAELKNGKLQLTLDGKDDANTADAINAAINAATGDDSITVTKKGDLTKIKETDKYVMDEKTIKGKQVDKKSILNVSDRDSANTAITTVNSALETVSKQRSKLGAVQNRLEHTIKNLDTSAENLQASESRIRDVDMAKEMMEQTKNNILQQASTAMLAQANQAPQTVLQLLG